MLDIFMAVVPDKKRKHSRKHNALGDAFLLLLTSDNA